MFGQRVKLVKERTIINLTRGNKRSKRKLWRNVESCYRQDNDAQRLKGNNNFYAQSSTATRKTETSTVVKSTVCVWVRVLQVYIVYFNADTIEVKGNHKLTETEQRSSNKSKQY